MVRLGSRMSIGWLTSPRGCNSHLRRSAHCLSLVIAAALLNTSCELVPIRLISDPIPCDRSLPPIAISMYLNQLVQPLIDNGEVYGLAVGILTPDGKTQVFGFGRTGTGDGRQILNGNTIFQIGSLSKLFISSLLVMLVADGTLHYEDTLRSIYPPKSNLAQQPARSLCSSWQLTLPDSRVSRIHSLSWAT